MPQTFLTPTEWRRKQGTQTSNANFKLWEDDDMLGLPETYTEAPESPSGVTGMISPGWRPRTWNRQKYDETTDAYQEHLGNVPDPKDYKPGIAGKIAAVATGALGGYLNASGKVRVPQESIDQTVEEFSMPGYRRARQRWADQESALRGQMGIEERRVEAEDRARGLENEALRSEAAMRTAEANERYRRYLEDRQRNLDEKPPAPMNMGGAVYLPGSDEFRVPPPQPPTPAQMEDLALRTRQINRTAGPQPPTAAELTRQSRETVRSLANRILTDTARQGGNIDNAVENAQRFYLDDPDVSEHRTEIIAELQAIAMSETQRNKTDRPSSARKGRLVSAATGQPTAPSSEGGGGGVPALVVKMRAPNGEVKDVPATMVEHYKSLGAVVVQ